MYHLTPVCRAIDYVEQHLKEPIDVALMAKAACTSLYHFCRVFNRITHHTPYKYLIRRRLTESAKELVTTSRKIIEIAFEYQFNSPEVYARAFKRMFGMLPREWRQHGDLGAGVLLPPLSYEYLLHINTQLSVLSCRALGPLTLVGLMNVTQDVFASRNSLWRDFEYEAVQAKLSGPLWGLSRHTLGREKKMQCYMAAIEGECPRLTTTPFVVKILPSSEYAVFRHCGNSASLALTFAYIFHTWLPQTERIHARPVELESCESFAPFLDDGLPAVREIFIPICSPRKP